MFVSSVHFVSQEGIMSPIHVVASTNMDPLQDPHLRIHVSTSLCLRLLCKIHVSGFMSQHPCVSQDPLQDPCRRIHSSAAICISGSSARSTSSDSCLSIFVSHGFSARSMSPDPCLSIFISQDPLQDPCLRIHVSDSCLSIRQYGSSARSMSPDSCLSIFVSQDSLQDPCLRIHVSASTNMDPLQEPRLRIHVSASLYLMDSLQDPCLRIHDAASIYISGSSARSMSPESCLSIFVSQDPLQDPCLRIHVSASLYLRSFCKIHVSDSCLSIPIIRFVVLRKRNANFDLRRRVLCSPAQGKQSGRDPRERFAQAKRKFWPPAECFAQAKRKFWPALTHFWWPCAGETQIWPPETRLVVSIAGGRTRSHDQLNENRHGATARRKKNFPAAVWRRRNANFDIRSRVFCGPAQEKNEQDKNLHLDLRGFTLTVRTPQCATLFGEKLQLGTWTHFSIVFAQDSDIVQ